MKIERKEGLKGVKVTHNKGVFWTAVVLFIILIAVVVAIKNIDRKAGVECSSDSDCAIAQTTVCPCNMGGSDACIARSEAGKYNFTQPANPEKGEIACAAVFNCKIKSCSCVAGKCFGLEE